MSSKTEGVHQQAEGRRMLAAAGVVEVIAGEGGWKCPAKKAKKKASTWLAKVILEAM